MFSKVILFILIALFICLPIVCIERNVVFPDVTVTFAKQFKYKLELKVHKWGRGNIHAMTCDKYDYYHSDWLFVNTLSGRIDSNQMMINKVSGNENNTLGVYSTYRGYIEITGNKLSVNIEFPSYADGVHLDRWWPYEFNGQYELRYDTTLSNIRNSK